MSLDTPVLCQFCVSYSARREDTIHELVCPFHIFWPDREVVLPRRGNIRVAGKLLNHLHRQFLGPIRDCRSAKVMWRALADA